MSQQPDYLLGIHNFKGRTEDELDILRGDYIEVIEDDSAFKDSWYIGRNLNTNATGLFPKAFTTAVASLPAEVKQRIDAQDAAGPAAPQPQPQPQAPAPAQPASPSPAASPLAQQQFYAPQQPLAVDTQFDAPAPAGAERAGLAPPPAQGLAQLALNGQQDAPSRSLSPASSGSHAHASGVSSSRGSVGSASNSRIPSNASGGSYRHASQSSQHPPSDIDAAISEMSGEAALMPPPTVLSWTPQNVEAYFMAKGFVEDAPKFVQHRITGPILLELDRETLKEIDIVSFGPRFAIDKELRFLRQVIGVAQSPVQDSPQSPLSAMGSQTFSPTAQTPQMGAQGFFPYGNQSYSSFGAQPGASVTTLSAQVQPNVQPNTVHAAQGVSEDAQAMQYPRQTQQRQPQPSPPLAQQHFAPSPAQPLQQQQQQQQPNQIQNPNQQYAQAQAQYAQPQYNQQQYGAQQYAAQQYAAQQYAAQPYQSERRPSRAQQQYGADAQRSEALPIPGALGSHSQSGSEEEITGSLGSNFSARPPASAAALAAAQAASQGTRGHHRHTSSATSRYSVVPSQGHARKRTLDDWESGLEPAVLEKSGPSGATHARNASNMSNKSSLRSSMPSVPSVPVDATTPSTVSSAAFDSKARKHTRSASESARSTRSAMSTDSKKHSRRASVLSLLPGSPKMPKSPKKGGDAGVNGAANGKISSPKRSNDSGGGANANGSANGGAGANGKRASSENTFKALMRPNLTKQKTSAFQEGIKSVTAEQASATASKSGWMHKRGGSGLGVWVKRFFTLHGTRLSYFSSFKDEKERGLIDITGHRVLPVKDHELLVSLSAAGMGAGRFCFKLVPPGPGYKKGVAFTAPKVHYFAVESEKEMREWQSALMSATIERDESQPVLSTSQTPTISLPKAQELMAARLAEKGDIGSLSGFAT